MHVRRFHVSGVVVVVVVALLLAASRRPSRLRRRLAQRRGPDRENVAADTGLLKQWPADGPPLAWQVDGVGNGYSTVIIVGGTLYTQGTVKGSEVVIAIDLATQKTLWAAPTARGTTPSPPPASPTA